ncbi:ABC transporter ATP-binding protein, partial [Lactiplantibacillus pentosus]|nr:ABC transporter ATP-binding protein [Lactiplantibacillus pentosus]MCT3298014.1 ABC transporter ATP-binding protein [Lactiplantibacillus pentosus]
MSEYTLVLRKRVIKMATDYVIAKQVSKHFG